MQKRKSVFRLRRRVRIAWEPIPWSTQGDPQIKENTWHISEPTFLVNICKNMAKKSKRCSKGWVDFRGGGLGGALHGIIWFLISKMIQKCSTGVQKWCKSAAKVPPGTRNCSKKLSQRWKNDSKLAPAKRPAVRLVFWAFLVRTCEAQYRILHDLSPGPADCAKRFQ